jgi:hypothetical protein
MVLALATSGGGAFTTCPMPGAERTFKATRELLLLGEFI